jgi:hypothetical protein
VSKVKDLIDQEAEAAETAEATTDDHAPLPEGTKVTRGHGRSRTLQIRLNADEHEALELLAKARDLPTSTVARSLLLSCLSPTDDLRGALDRLETDLAAVRRQLLKG